MSEQATEPSTAVELDRLTEAARDSLTDDMVARLAETTSGAMDLIDQVNRSGVANAIPALAQMVHDGDLERLVQLARLYGSAQDALTDEMVGRLSDTMGTGLGLLDQVNRSNLEGALPVISRMIADGDLERIAQLARLIGSAQDALTDEMVGRLAETLGEGLSMLDRLNRCGLGRLITIMEHMEATGTLEHLGEALLEAGEDVKHGKPATGGFGSLWRLVSDRENQEVMRFLFAFGRRMRPRT
jgi:Asp-tRNA(Asn)/Glu-tRNA(Gln) amidotransferase C subunit